MEWTWDGNDEMDPAQGRGWAVVKGDELHGMIFFHGGDDSEFVAKRATAEEGDRSGSERHMAKEHPRLKLGKRAPSSRRI